MGSTEKNYEYVLKKAHETFGDLKRIERISCKYNYQPLDHRPLFFLFNHWRRGCRRETHDLSIV
jgi:hypothetical protein